MADKPTVLVCAGRLSSDVLSTDYLHHLCISTRVLRNEPDTGRSPAHLGS